MAFGFFVSLNPLLVPKSVCPMYPKASGVETVQDFLIKLGIKPLMHLLEISIFSLNNDLPKL